jgi:hypothetical protein
VSAHVTWSNQTNNVECCVECSAEAAEERWARTESWLKALGATVVVKDQASIKVQL